jgi:hypothetical protein
MRTRELRGTVADGGFPDEAIFSFNDRSGADVSVIAPRSFVKQLKGTAGRLRVRVLDRQGALFLVELPGEVFGAGRSVTVDEAVLEPG